MSVSIVDRSQKTLLGKLRFTGTIFVKTGLHIGAGEENLEIGGIDKLVVRDPITRYPYIPGSSIRGKLRSILERVLNKPINRNGGSQTWRYESDDLVDGYSEISRNENLIQVVPFQGARNCEVSRLFGSTGVNCWIERSLALEEGLEVISDRVENIEEGKDYVNVKGRNAPARLMIRDCHLLPHSAEELRLVDTGLFMTEWKFENGIDRVTSAANPRQIERVPASSEFSFELVYTMEEIGQAVEDLNNLVFAIAILIDDALGGHGSRGYGKVLFKDIKLYRRTIVEYRQGNYRNEPFLEFQNIDDMLKHFGSLNDEIQKFLPAK